MFNNDSFSFLHCLKDAHFNHFFLLFSHFLSLLTDIIKCVIYRHLLRLVAPMCARTQNPMQTHVEHKCSTRNTCYNSNMLPTAGVTREVAGVTTTTSRIITIIGIKNTRGGRKGNITQTFPIWTLIMIRNHTPLPRLRGVSCRTITRAARPRRRRSGAFLILTPLPRHRRPIQRDIEMVMIF